ncbi:MAG: deoxyribose-phosphate aldolase [Anaerolineae bacterium]|nr:deoxyribose-phosphate aldolase [Anaerolineae bacterium]
MKASNYSFEQLVELITSEVLAAYPLEGAACSGCGTSCNGHCAGSCPDRCREVVQAGADRLSARLGTPRVAADLASMIDHTLLKPDGTEAQIRTLCAEARENHFATVCVNPAWVALSAELLRGSGVKVCTVVGFPLGATLPEVKAFETERAIAAGASEIDMVQNIGALKSRDYQLVMRDVSAVVQAAHARQASVKVIIEAALLTDEEKVESCAIAQAAGADYVKTSTGFASGGATAADVALMRAVVGPSIGVKAAGGIRSAEDAKAMIAAGATRLGASAGIKIVREAGGS